MASRPVKKEKSHVEDVRITVDRAENGGLDDIEVEVALELGQTWITLDEALALDEQSLLALDQRVGEPIQLLINGKPFARGQVVTVQENFGVRIDELIGQQ